MSDASRESRFACLGTRYSTIAPWLWRYGYRKLLVVDLTFKRPSSLGSIRYLPGDLTQTGLATGSLGAMTCMSVIEHGVDLHAYFAEAARLLRPGGVLATSTDFHPDPPDTGGKQAYGGPIRIFDTPAVESALATAREYGLEPTASLVVGSPKRPVRWERYGLSYTFALFTLRRTA